MSILSGVPLVWRKSSRSDAIHCVEVASDGNTIFVRDSKDTQGPVLAFNATVWRSFVRGVVGE
jgi:hypothetical protein